jgi:hypothetical protein
VSVERTRRTRPRLGRRAGLAAAEAAGYALGVRLAILVSSLALLTFACGGEAPTELDHDGGAGGSGGAAQLGCDASAPATRTISCVESFTPGPGAGFGQDAFPDIVYGDPVGGGDMKGGTDVLSLGKGGEIVFGFGGNAIVDGDGVDFLVFENAFYKKGQPDQPFAEVAEVAVSDDGVAWSAFPCAKDAYPFEGCAGWHPVFANDALGISALDPAVAGGDGFDLAAIGITHARFVRIRDLGSISAAPNAGFDLDAAAIVNAAVAGE